MINDTTTHATMDVLFVDDDIDDREFFKDALSYVDPKINCILAKNCEQALTILEEMQVLPKYVFLDIHMPEMDGKSGLERIKSNSKFNGVKVVMYSNSNDEALIAEYKALGATYFLIKPPTFKGLCDSLMVLFDK